MDTVECKGTLELIAVVLPLPCILNRFLTLNHSRLSHNSFFWFMKLPFNKLKPTTVFVAHHVVG
jgi:hypothetical protein